MDAKKKGKNWGPAIGYYDLAIAIDPSSGIPYNQIAIISKAEGDHARALYNLYRALSAYESPRTAFDNLNLELKKIREAEDRDGPHTDRGVVGDDLPANLQHWFPLLHSHCSDCTQLGDYDSIENKVLGQLMKGLNERSLKTSFLNRTVISNIAADFAAGDRWQGNHT